ncbi:hypothetical protein HOLleu_01092 [Holothuria leucospilota]|uniref:Uncharacterized protein n=1 Tax=Holothuria leucospilota TaxID=206669 RepID=A0A9Q1CQD2_HOLLE|nr:hypothetical protein HOLleu_01092 [Holothuria leucospilota]
MRDSRKRSRIFQFCKSLGVDFVFLQETHIVNEDVYAWSYEWGGGLHAFLGSVSSCGSVILVSPRWTSLVGKVDHDHEGRVICITIKHPCGSFILYNVYAPNQPTDRRDRTLKPAFSTDLKYLDEKLHGARVRARVHCVEAEEKPTIKFYRDVTKYAIDRRIKRVRDVHVVVHKDPLDIVEVFKSFYEQLYTQADVDEGLQKSLLDNIDKTPSRDQNDELGSPLTVDELWKAVAKMKGGKAPGSDGIPVEFYKRFWGTVGQDLRDVFVSAFLAGSLSPSQRTGVITLLPKSRDPLEPKNKRPITLLNVDYKILAKALSNRLGTVMPDLVGSFQTCAVRGHSIQQNLWLVRDLNT